MLSEIANKVFSDGRLLIRHSKNGEWRTQANLSSDWFQPRCSVRRVVETIRSDILADILLNADAEWLISLPPSGQHGFSCDLFGMFGVSNVRILFGELETDCPDFDTALVWLGRALSDSYRLRTRKTKKRTISATLEPAEVSSGKPMIEVGYGI